MYTVRLSFSYCMPLFCKFFSGLLAGPLGWHVHVHSSSPAYIVVVDATAALTVKVPPVWFLLHC
jgi:hypothetical protein